MHKKTFIAFSLILAGFGCQPTVATITSFETCASAGNPIMESFPRQCRANGQTFVEKEAPRPEPSMNVQLGEAFTLQAGQSRAIQGGLRVTLLEINDSRCQPGVQCIWAGELAAKLKLEGPEDTAPEQEMILGTLRAKTAEASGYRFELKDASESFATLVVTR